MPRPLFLLLVIACSLLLAACGEDDEVGAGATATPAAPSRAPAPAAEEAGCQKVAAPDPRSDGSEREPTLSLDAGKTYVAIVTTSCGTFEITLDAERAPVTGGSFVTLARKGFFDDLTFHRIVPNFVIQGGDPTGTGMGGPGYSVTEAPPADLTYAKGVVAMAKTGADEPGTSGSQFYVVSGSDGETLPAEYALLGKVTEGLEVVDAIGAVQADSEGRPADPVVIERIRVRVS